jgi:hypothetical protein
MTSPNARAGVGEVERAQQAADDAANAEQRDRNQRRGVDNDQPSQNPETDATATDHPTGEQQAHENAENDPPA